LTNPPDDRGAGGIDGFAQVPAGEPESDLYLGELELDESGDADEGVLAEVREQTQGALSRSVILVGSKAATWILAFVMTVMMPRYLGATGFGRLYLAMSLTGIASIVVEFGLNSLVAREVSKHREQAMRYLVNAGVLKTALWAISCVVLAVVVQVAHYPAETQIAVALLAVSVLFAALSSLVVAVLQSDDRMRWIALATIVEKIVYVGLGVAALVLGYGVLAIAAVTALGSAAGFALDIWWLRRLAAEKDLTSGGHGIDVRTLFVKALPFFSVLVFGAIYFRVDVVIMSLLASDDVVGYYGAAYRLFQTTYILPDAFLFAFFPLFCRLAAREGDDALSVAAQKGIDLLMLVGLPIAVGICALSEGIIRTLYGTGFDSSILVLRVLSVAIVLMYANGVFVQLLIATNRQKKLAVTAMIAAVFNLSVNFALVPALGGVGAAIATVATEALVIVVNGFFLPRDLFRRLSFVAPAKALAASLVMAAVLWPLGGWNVFVLVPIGVLVYGVAILVLRAIPAEDWAMLKSAMANMGRA
jgi:O-antigen/teichoic acid export membrane protein